MWIAHYPLKTFKGKNYCNLVYSNSAKRYHDKELKGQNGLVLTSYKKTQIYNGLNTGKCSWSSDAVKIFFSLQHAFLRVWPCSWIFVRTPVISTTLAARWRNKINNTCCFSLKRLPGSHSQVPLHLMSQHSVTRKHLTARAVEEC